jgi:hypothetical protein
MGARGTAGAVLAALSLAATAQAEPRAGCTAQLTARRVLVDPTLEQLFDAEQLRLVRLGLVGQVHLEVTLVRHHPLWFDEHLETRAVDFSLRWSREEVRYLLDGQPVDPSHLSLERLVLHPGADTEGELEVEETARLQVVTSASLGTVAGWMVAGERGPATRTVLDVLANDLVRTTTGRCAVTR